MKDEANTDTLSLAPQSARTAFWAVGGFYALYFLGRGGVSPFIPLWFQDQGLSSAAIAVTLAAPNLARVVTGPLSGIWADRLRLQRTSLVALSCIAAIGYAALCLLEGFLPLFGAFFIATTASVACLPLVDVIAMQMAARSGPPYSRYRSVGSGAYAVASFLVGSMVRAVGPIFVIIWTAACALGSLVTALWLPPTPTLHREREGRTTHARLTGLARDKGFLLILASSGLIVGSHALYYSFATIIWRANGLSGAMIGALWTTCVVAEIAYLSLGEQVRRRLSPWKILGLAGTASVLRWIVLAFEPPLAVLFVVQASHAFSFTATFMAALQLVSTTLHKHDVTLGQSTCAAIILGFCPGLLMLGCGWLYSAFGSLGYLAMIGFAAVGAGIALRRFR